MCNHKTTLQCHSSATSAAQYHGSLVYEKVNTKAVNKTILKSYLLLLLNTHSPSGVLIYARL